MPSSNKLTCSHLKIILKNNECLSIIIIIHITNTCIKLEYWPLHYKRSTTIVISKLNKKLYDFPKSFRPIILLNTVGNLIEKVIRGRLQFNMASNNFIHPSQLSSLKFKSMIDVGIALTYTYIIRLGWVKNMSMSILTFDISQFFPSLNHQCYGTLWTLAFFFFFYLFFLILYFFSFEFLFLFLLVTMKRHVTLQVT